MLVLCMVFSCSYAMGQSELQERNKAIERYLNYKPPPKSLFSPERQQKKPEQQQEPEEEVSTLSQIHDSKEMILESNQITFLQFPEKMKEEMGQDERTKEPKTEETKDNSNDLLKNPNKKRRSDFDYGIGLKKVCKK